MKLRALLPVPLLLLAQAFALGQGDPEVVKKIVDEGKNRNQVMKHLEHLTKKIGPRLTSSPQLQKACEWTASKFKEYGLKNVNLEQWGEFPVGFERGKKQSGRMVAPEKLDFEFTTASWTPGTDGKKTGVAVAAPTTMEEFEKVKDKVKGAWIVYKTRLPGGGRRPGGGPPEKTDVEKALDEAGILGRVGGSTNDLVLTGGNHRITWEDLPKDVRITIRKKDMDAVAAKLDSGTEVKLEFEIEQKFVKGPRPLYNVIAEIPGTEKPDEVVIISGHLDSWDGPGSEGALDNGTGTMVALEAARILMKTGVKPKRTIRFILWTGEEQGLFGSAAYVEKHSSELPKISAVFVDDGGTNYQGGLTVAPMQEAFFKEAFAPAMEAFPELPMKLNVVERPRVMGGSDHASFARKGVPGYFWMETGRSNYTYVHHTQHDSLDQAIPEYLVQSSTNSAVVAYLLANYATLLPRETPPSNP